MRLPWVEWWSFFRCCSKNWIADISVESFWVYDLEEPADHDSTAINRMCSRLPIPAAQPPNSISHSRAVSPIDPAATWDLYHLRHIPVVSQLFPSCFPVVASTPRFDPFWSDIFHSMTKRPPRLTFGRQLRRPPCAMGSTSTKCRSCHLVRPMDSSVSR